MYYYQPFVRNTIQSGNLVRSKPNTLRVSGEGKLAVQPDQANIKLGVITEDQELQKAQEQNAAAISNVKKALNAIGITDKQIQTSDFSIFPQYDFVDGKQIFRGYKVEHILDITVNEIENTGLVVDTAVDSGANTVRGITFETENSQELYQKALGLAVLDAIRKAETIASSLRVQLISTPVSVSEGTLGLVQPVSFESSTFVKSAVSTPIQPGTIEIESHITAEFIYYS
ncbi:MULTISPECIES: SIMPL domain-containing protein [Cytobacillus]|uniref:SIMPL domain-containing protein n=1 Tax=Cytobacillus TaxID=2675230 RepID=UPI00203FCE15|nr:SIMPL domain-containing protein [Cytobacillus firmus]MCM3704568.1 SIMPL domain-containing protein [Cytobacillus firmus]